jgi:hypothetical protein
MIDTFERARPAVKRLTSRQNKEFTYLKALVVSNLAKTGDALWTIYQRGYWRSPTDLKPAGYTEWGEFCADEFGHAKSFSYSIKDLGKVRSAFPECTTQEQSRVLANLPEMFQAEVWARASKEMPGGLAPTGFKLRQALADAINEEEEEAKRILKINGGRPRRSEREVIESVEAKIRSIRRQLRKYLPQKAARIDGFLDLVMRELRT